MKNCIFHAFLAGTILGLFDTIALSTAPEALAFSAGRVLYHALPAGQSVHMYGFMYCHESIQINKMNLSYPIHHPCGSVT